MTDASTIIVDTGYTRICPRCVSRWGTVPFLKGRARDVRLEKCKPCADKPDDFRFRDRARKRR